MASNKPPVRPKRIHFARVGHMKYFAGPQEGDEKPIAGGKYNKFEVGGELYNFKVVNGNMRGYYQPFYRKNVDFKSTNLERIDPSIDGDKYLDNVLIIFIAKHPKYGQTILGWYSKGRIYRDFQPGRKYMARDEFGFNLVCESKNAVLIPSDKRVYQIPKGKRKPGQANAFYLYDNRGVLKRDAWIHKAVDYVLMYKGDNVLELPEAEVDEEVAGLIETSQLKRKGQGISISPVLRKMIEDHAVKRATTYFKSKGYLVEYVGSYRPYDLSCTKGRKTLMVEVKGTQTAGEQIILTVNEVNNAKKNSVALFILHSIQSVQERKSFTVSGGVPLVVDPWVIERHGKLAPTHFKYSIK